MEQTHIKQILSHIESKQVNDYLMSSKVRKQLGYPQCCCKQVEDPKKFKEFVTISAQILATQKGRQICHFLLVQEWSSMKQYYLPEKQVIDYEKYRTGLSYQLLQQKAKEIFNKNAQQKIQKIIKGKIVLGYDMSELLSLLGIEHNDFIDIIHLYPHHFGLPLKFPLKQISLEQLKIRIDLGHQSLEENCQAILGIVRRHIEKGKGVIEQLPYKHNKDFNSDPWSIIEELNLKEDKVCAFFLRGSRALNLVLNEEDYVSDWDYFCVYDTATPIEGRLLKMKDIDVTFFDRQTFERELYENSDIPMVELLYLPENCIFKNQFKTKEFSSFGMSKSIQLHMHKGEMKIRRLSKEPIQKWKILKALHLKVRYMDHFMQFLQFGQIKDVKRTNCIWDDIKNRYKKDKKFEEVVAYARNFDKETMLKLREKYKMPKNIRKNQELNLQVRNYQNHAETKYQLHSSEKYYSPNQAHDTLAIVKQCRLNGLKNMDEYKIKYRQHQKYPNLVQFHYLQSANFKNQICRQARGIILNTNKNYQVVSMPYTKFFNHDQKYADPDFEFDKCHAFQKLDGSIASLYCYRGEWNVASSCIPDGATNYCFGRPETLTQFDREFWKIFNEKKFYLPKKEDEDKTFIFELLSKNHIIVVERDQSDLVLHGVRDTKTIQELDHTQYGKKYNWSVNEPLKIQTKNLKELIQLVESRNPKKFEGLVLCDHKYRRLKVKNTEYNRINWLGQLNLTADKDPRRYIFIHIVLQGLGEKFKTFCPEWQKLIDSQIGIIERLNKTCLQRYKMIKHLGKKEFAVAIEKDHKKFQPFLFALRKNQKKYVNHVETAISSKKMYKWMLEQYNS